MAVCTRQASRCQGAVVTDDGSVVLMHYTGLGSRQGADSPTAWGEQYMRLFITFDTGAAHYQWA
jgi:hypothetical protein